MADAKKSQLTTCDGIDHGITLARHEQLQNEALAFNQLLRVNEPDAHSINHSKEATEANKAFYDFLPGGQSGVDLQNQNSNEGRAFDASKAFYEQATQLPVGERRALLKATLEENKAMSSSRNSLPVISVNMDSTAFIDGLNVSYGNGSLFTFNGSGMCTELKAPELNDPPIVTSSYWTITLPTFNR